MRPRACAAGQRNTPPRPPQCSSARSSCGDTLDRLFRTVAHGEAPREADLARLAGDEAAALSQARLVPAGGGYGWSWDGDETLERPLWPVVHAAVALLTGGPLDRVKGCASCRFLFVDESRNRSRRWCSMDDCGTQDKMRAYVARRRAARATRTPGAVTARGGGS